MIDPTHPVLPADSLQRAITAVFQRPEYRRSLRRTLLEDILDWIASMFRAIENSVEAHPVLRIIIGAVVLAFITVTVGRSLYLSRMKEEEPGILSVKQSSVERDPWKAAEASALAGNYLEAAHSLYAAVLHTLARSDRLVIESAKTVGDYTRELRTRTSKSLPLYRDFARLYEPMVWRDCGCGPPEFERLLAIASKLAGRVS